jgi:hypothetical protein
VKRRRRSIVHQEDFRGRAVTDDTKEADIEAAVDAGFLGDGADFLLDW